MATVASVRETGYSLRESNRLGLCRVSDTGPLMIYPPVLRGRCPKAFREGTRGVWRAACGLWGFDGAAGWVRVVLSGVVGGRSTIAIDNFSPPLPRSR